MTHFARLLPVLALLVLPAAAQAVETEGRGENITHVKNIPYPNTLAPTEMNTGTDTEFATIEITKTVQAKDTKASKKDTTTTSRADVRVRRLLRRRPPHRRRHGSRQRRARRDLGVRRVAGRRPGLPARGPRRALVRNLHTRHGLHVPRRQVRGGPDRDGQEDAHLLRLRHVHRRCHRPVQPEDRLVLAGLSGLAQHDRAPVGQVALQLELRPDHVVPARDRDRRHLGHQQPGRPPGRRSC